MKEMFAGISDADLPPETKAKFFCKYHQEKLGVICMNKLTCDRCGWNPVVESKRKKNLKEKERSETFKYDLQRHSAEERGE